MLATENNPHMTPCPLGNEYLDFQEEIPISCGVRSMPEVSEYPEEEKVTLLPCIVCNRTFSPQALERHRKVCEKISSKKRQTFDTTKKRTDEFDVSRGLNNSDIPPKQKSRWREKRAEFLRAIRAAKNVSDEEDNVDGERRSSVPSDYIQCPFCSRHFGPKAADRHIDWCKEQKNRLPKCPTQEDSEAVNRLKARTKYTPPRPGQSGWRAPRKKDVISSIPPQNAGANITPAGRLVTPPLPGRHLSPPPMSPSRKASSSSLPAGPPRYGTSSLGRSAGRQIASMLNSGIHNYNGMSSSYGAPTFGSPHSSGPNVPFQRTSSLRLPKRRQGASQRMARHRDLASDMLASVMGDGNKRMEPEGGESIHSMKSYEKNQKAEDYDPFSAAELQFQSLLSSPKDKAYSMMGSTGSLKNVGLKVPDRHYGYKPHQKPRSSSLGGGYHTMSLYGLNYNDDNNYSLKNSTNASPEHIPSPDEHLNFDFLNDFTSKSPRYSPDRATYKISPSRSPSKFSPSRSPMSSFSRENSVEPLRDLILSLEETAGNRKPADGGNYKTSTKPSVRSLFSPKKLSPERENKDRDDDEQRVSSSSSTDSSLPALSSPPSSSSPMDKPISSTLAQITRFCHECGQKYPVAAAKFCCQCGARRIYT